jgi:adenylate cyclase
MMEDLEPRSMNTEHERKYLVDPDDLPKCKNGIFIRQGFLSVHPDRVVRVRLIPGGAQLTIKGRSTDDGLSRSEWEREIDEDEATQLLELCGDQVVDKTRYVIPIDEEVAAEVDVFEGRNKGLIIAEVELPEASTRFEIPGWFGKEVTGTSKFYNAALAVKPFQEW